MAFEWFRSWHGAPTDAKYRVIARRAGVAPGMVSAVYWALLDYASQNEPRGSVEGFDAETYAEWAGWEESDVQAIIDAFTTKQAIIDGQIVAWGKRQPKKEDPTGAERQARYRDAQRNASNEDNELSDNVTQSNAASRDVTQKNARLDKSTLDKNQRDEGIARPPAAAPVTDFPEQDPDWGAAISKLEGANIGGMSGSVLLELNAVWPDFSNGRRDWLDDAILVAKANNAHSPTYAIRVLAGAIRDNKRPGSAPERKTTQAPQGRNLKKLLGLEDDDGISPFSAKAT